MHATRSFHSTHSREQGGVTILVALALLVLLTITALGMSRNAFREVIVSGTTRQGSMVRNLADSGIEAGILWMRPSAQYTATGTTDAGIQSLASKLVSNQMFGIAYMIDGTTQVTTANTATPAADAQIPAGSGNGYNVALTCMGKMPMTGQSQTAGATNMGYTPAAGSLALTAPDVWAFRSDGVLSTGGMTFVHSKEAWISSPPR